MFEKRTKFFKWIAIFAWVAFFAQAHAQSLSPQSSPLFKIAMVDEASKGAGKVLIEAGPTNNLRRFEVSRLSDPSKSNWAKFEGQWKAKHVNFPKKPHLANWSGNLLSVWQSPDREVYVLLDLYKEQNGLPSWFFVRFDKIERPLAFFPEATLEEAIGEAVRVEPSKLTKKLLADRLVSFELNGAEVRDLSGLEDAKNLEVLTLRNNLVSDLTPLAGLPKLRRLELHGNRMESLKSLKNLPSLVELGLSHNRLKGLTGLEGSPNLQKLDVSANDLRDLEGISNLENLQILHAQDNKLGVNEPFEDLNENKVHDPGEQFKDLSGNGKWDNDPLAELDGLFQCREAYLYGNGLTDLSGMGDLPVIRTLLLGVNEIDDITPLRKYTSLQYLSLNSNQVADFNPLSSLRSLAYLDLSKNRLSDLRPLRSINYLRILLLNDNNLSDLRPLASQSLLESLSISSNLVSDLRPLATLSKLRTLDASQNLIDLKTAWNAPAINSIVSNKVRVRTFDQAGVVDGINQLCEALIGDKLSNARLGVFLEENGYQRLRDYHVDDKIPSKKKTVVYRSWIKMILDNETDQFSELEKL